MPVNNHKLDRDEISGKKHMIFGIKISEFTKNAITISKGSLISQVLLVIATPVLTRLYTPGDFGELALFTSLYSILAGIFTSKFDLAIVLPKEDNISIKLMKLTLFISLIFSSIFLFILILFKLLSHASIPLYLILLPFLTFTGAVYSVMQHWFSRKTKFHLTARSVVMNSAVNVSLCFLLFLFLPNKNSHLVTAYFLGFTAATFYLTYYFLRQNSALWKENKKGILVLFRQYSHFPRYMVPTALLGILSYQIIPILLKQFFSTETVGYYSIANRFLVLPSILLGVAIGEVFRVEMAKQNNEGKDIKPLFSSTLKKMLLIGGPVFLAFLFLSPRIFQWVLGSKYQISGIYARYLCFAVFGQFLVQPFSNVFIVKNRMKILFLFQLILTLIPMLTIPGGGIFFHNIKYSFIFLSIFTFITSCLAVFVSYRCIHEPKMV